MTKQDFIVPAERFNIMFTISYALIKHLAFEDRYAEQIEKWQRRFNTAYRLWCWRNKMKYEHTWVVENKRVKKTGPIEQQFFPHSHNATIIDEKKFNEFEAFLVGWVMQERKKANDFRPTIINGPNAVLLVSKLSKNTNNNKLMSYFAKQRAPRAGRKYIVPASKRDKHGRMIAGYGKE